MFISKFAWQKALLLAFAIALSGVAQGAEMRSVHNAKFECSLSADGAYSVRYAGAGWTLQGKLAQPSGAVKAAAGEDRAGYKRRRL